MRAVSGFRSKGSALGSEHGTPSGDARQVIEESLPLRKHRLETVLRNDLLAKGSTEARAQSEIDREATAAFWAEARAQNAEARAAGNEAFEGEQAFRRHTAAAERGVETAIDAADDAVDAGMHAATRGMSGLAKAVEKALSTIFGFFSFGCEPKFSKKMAIRC